MKYFIVVAILDFVAFISHAQPLELASVETSASMISPLFIQQESYSLHINEVAKPPGLSQYRTGRALTFLGFFIAVPGIFINKNSREVQSYNPNTGKFTTEKEASAYLGIVMTVTGVGMVIPGVILWSKGSKRYHQYLDSKKATTSIQFKGGGLALNYRF